MEPVTLQMHARELTILLAAGRFGQAAALLAATPEAIAGRFHVGETPLHYLAIEDDLAAVRWLVEHGADANTTDSSGTPVLVHVTQVAGVETLRVLLEAGADPNSRGMLDESALQCAARRSNEKAKQMVTLLLDAGADLEACDDLGLTPTFALAENDEHEAVRLLAAQGADLNVVNSLGDTMLMAAVRRESDAMMRTLLDIGVAVNGRGQDGDTALHVAAMEGDIAAALCLHEHGADLAAVCEQRLTFLDCVGNDQRQAWREAFDV